MENVKSSVPQLNQPGENYHQDLVAISPKLDEMVSKMRAGEGKGSWFWQSISGAAKLIFKNGTSIFRAGVALAGGSGASLYLKSLYQGVSWMWFAGGCLVFLLLCFYAIVIVYQKQMLDISSKEFNLAFFRKKRRKEYEEYWKLLLERRVSFTALKEFVTPLLRYSDENSALRELNRELQESNALLKEKVSILERDDLDAISMASIVEEYEALLERQLKVSERTSRHLKRLAYMLGRMVAKGELKAHDLLMVFEEGFVIYEFSVSDGHLYLLYDEGTPGHAYTQISHSAECIETKALKENWAAADDKLAVKIVTPRQKIWILVIDYDTMFIEKGNENFDVILAFCQSVVSFFEYSTTPIKATTIEYTNPDV